LTVSISFKEHGERGGNRDLVLCFLARDADQRLDWIIEKSDLSEDVKSTAKYYRASRSMAA